MFDLETLQQLAQAAFWITGTIAFLVAAASGRAAWRKHSQDVSTKAWDQASQAYDRFLDLAIEHPQFVRGYWSGPSRTPEERNEYRWFMARFLWSAEQALRHVAEEEKVQWERVVKAMLREHSDFIASPETRDEVNCYFGPLKKLIDETVAETHPQAPASAMPVP